MEHRVGAKHYGHASPPHSALKLNPSEFRAQASKETDDRT